MIQFSVDDRFIVSGASSGIGKGISIFLNSLGATVIGIGRDIERLNHLKSVVKNPNNLHIEAKNLVEDIELLPRYIKKLKEKYGKFRGLICSAGIDMPTVLRIVEYEKSKHVFDINYFVPLFMTKGFANKSIHTENNASVIFIASTAGIYPDKGQLVYSATKAAVIAAAKSISKELSGIGVRVNSIAPAEVDTPMYQRSLNNIGKDINNYPLGIGSPDDIASMVAFLLSDKARWITGQNYILDGGAF